MAYQSGQLEKKLERYAGLQNRLDSNAFISQQLLKCHPTQLAATVALWMKQGSRNENEIFEYATNVSRYVPHQAQQEAKPTGKGTKGDANEPKGKGKKGKGKKDKKLWQHSYSDKYSPTLFRSYSLVLS